MTDGQMTDEKKKITDKKKPVWWVIARQFRFGCRGRPECLPKPAAIFIRDVYNNGINFFMEEAYEEHY